MQAGGLPRCAIRAEFVLLLYDVFHFEYGAASAVQG